MKLNTHGIKVAAVCSYCYFVPLLVEGEDEIWSAFRGIKKKGKRNTSSFCGCLLYIFDFCHLVHGLYETANYFAGLYCGE